MREVLDLNRRFRRIDDEHAETMAAWSDLLAQRCVVVLGEGGMGKTTEFQAQSANRRQEGDFAFFCELVALAEGELRDALDPDDDSLIAEWRSSTRDAFFFLDSLDEAKLQGKTLRRALSNLRRGLGKDWTRARLIVSSRDSDWLLSDRQDLQKAMGLSEPLMVTSLAPLERDQFEKLALHAGVADFPALWQAVQDQAAQDFAARPADASWLAEYWAEKRQIVDLTDLIENNLEKRCRERSDRAASLDPLTVLRGVRALAGLALLEQRWSFTVLGSEIDRERHHESLDPAQMLFDWKADDIRALLRLPLFDESSYGRVRLHHRIVHEYLAAQWLNELLHYGWPYHELEGLLFRGSAIGSAIPAHLHAAAAWLAASRSELADRLIREAPELLLLHGDPSRLRETTRREALRAFAERYADRKYLGEWFGSATLRRFACPALAPLVSEHLTNRDRPQELRTTLLNLVEHGLSECTDQALYIACSDHEPEELRVSAVRAVSAAGTPSQRRKLLAALATDSPPKLVAAAMKALYPRTLGVLELVDLALCACSPSPYSSNEVTRVWRRLLRMASREERYALLVALNAKLADILLPKTLRHELWGFELLAEAIVQILSAHVAPEADVSAPELERALELLRRASSAPWHFRTGTQVGDALREHPGLRRRLFWLAVAAGSQGSVELDSWRRLPYRRELWTPSASDNEWLRRDAMSSRPLPERLVAFDVLCRGLLDEPSLGSLVTQEPAFADHLRTMQEEFARLDDDPLQQELQALEQEQEQENQRTQSAIRRFLDNNLDAIRAGTNVSLLLRLLSASDSSHDSYGDVSTAPLRDAYGDDVAAAAEAGWRAFWRLHTPQLPHQRVKGNRIEERDELGLVGVTIELRSVADLHAWPHADAARAARYACVDLGGFPEWLEAIALAHPHAVRDGIEAPLRGEYEQPRGQSGYSALIDSLTRSGPAVQAALGPIVSDCLHHSTPGSAGVTRSCLELVAQAPEACTAPPLDVVEARCRANIGSSERFAVWMRHWIDHAPETAVDALIELTQDGLPPQAGASSAEGHADEPAMITAQANAGERPVRAEDLVIALLTEIHDHRLHFPSKGSDPVLNSQLALLRLLPHIYRYVPVGATSHTEAQWSRDRFLSLALHPEQGLSTEQLLRIADSPEMKEARDAILVAAKHRATLDATGESNAIEKALTSLYRQRGTGALEYLRSLRGPASVTPDSLLQDLVAVSQSLIDRFAVLPESEDEISDWLLEMLRHRLTDRGVAVGDQARGGLSASQRGAGERDAVLRHQGRIIGVFEALRMRTCDKNAITSHLNKIPNYDLVGAPGIFVAAYFQGPTFDTWVAKYTTTVEQHTIAGWKLRSPRTDYVLENLGMAQRVLRLVYDTPRGEQVVFHLLLDLGSAYVKRDSPSKTTSLLAPDDQD
jgi:hypothetical protein